MRDRGGRGHTERGGKKTEVAVGTGICGDGTSNHTVAPAWPATRELADT